MLSFHELSQARGLQAGRTHQQTYHSRLRVPTLPTPNSTVMHRIQPRPQDSARRHLSAFPNVTKARKKKTCKMDVPLVHIATKNRSTINPLTQPLHMIPLPTQQPTLQPNPSPVLVLHRQHTAQPQPLVGQHKIDTPACTKLEALHTCIAHRSERAVRQPNPESTTPKAVCRQLSPAPFSQTRALNHANVQCTPPTLAAQSGQQVNTSELPHRRPNPPN